MTSFYNDAIRAVECAEAEHQRETAALRAQLAAAEAEIARLMVGDKLYTDACLAVPWNEAKDGEEVADVVRRVIAERDTALRLRDEGLQSAHEAAHTIAELIEERDTARTELERRSKAGLAQLQLLAKERDEARSMCDTQFGALQRARGEAKRLHLMLEAIADVKCVCPCAQMAKTALESGEIPPPIAGE